MSIAVGSQPCCAGSGPAREAEDERASLLALNGCTWMALSNQRAEKPGGCSCPPGFCLALAAFALEQEGGPNKHLALVMDQAGCHTKKDLVVPQGLHLLFLPSHSPELHPAERVGPLSHEPRANRTFPSLDELEQVQPERCRWLHTHPEGLRDRTSFPWWPSSFHTTETDLI